MKTLADSSLSIRDFAVDLRKIYGLPGRAGQEDQLKAPVAALLKRFGGALGHDVETKTEAQPDGLGARPDVAVYVGGLICGYVELKAPGLGADPARLKGERNKRQWEKFKSLPNLLYADGRDWALYRNGERVGEAVRFAGDPVKDGAKAVDPESAAALGELLRDFLFWAPIIPHGPRELARYLAPLTALLREEAGEALTKPNSAIGGLKKEWRDFFFPEADDRQFCDAYAQTVTFALLLARVEGAKTLEPHVAAQTLDSGNGLLAQTLRILGQDGAREELRLAFELLRRSLEALDPHDLSKRAPDLWLFFYEDFLAAYDPKLRADYGVYYTPLEVVRCQVRLAAELLAEKFGKTLGFADDGVVFLDPAAGTGAYLVAAAEHGLDLVRQREGEGAVGPRASQIAANMHGFEILVGPYAVAHLRLAQEIKSAGGTPPDGRVKLYLADALESPHTAPPGGLDLTHRKLTQERENARKLKKDGRVLVILGNPPYDRQHIEWGDVNTRRKGGWVRYGDGGQDEKPILEDFLAPARKAKAGIHLKNLYNDYVYFWRWALWRALERQEDGGVVTFITASSYLNGPGFVGMREHMRRSFDDLWILDLGGDGLGTRKTANVFNIQTPVAIAIGVRGKTRDSSKPARVRYARINGASRQDKLAALDEVGRFSDIVWRDCPLNWKAPFLPSEGGAYSDWPLLAALFPMRHSGAQFKRTWPIGVDTETLRERWNAFLSLDFEGRREAFVETGDRTIGMTYAAGLPGDGAPSLASLQLDAELPAAKPYMLRSFDRRVAFYDVRFGDRLRPALAALESDEQIFFSTLMTDAVSNGPAMLANALMVDMHVFCGRGAKDVIPLWRDAEATIPNVADDLLEMLSRRYRKRVPPQDLFAYVYALLGGLGYARRFDENLATPGPRVPLTRSRAVFDRTAALGRRLIRLHTYGERFVPEGEVPLPPGAARCLAAVPDDPAGYPENFSYDPQTREIRVGSGRFGPVSPEAWSYQVSGLEVVKSWLRYRMKKGYGKKSSPLDDIRPDRWTPRMTQEFLELLWVLDQSLALEPELEAALDAVLASPCFRADELPQPTEAERKPPKLKKVQRAPDLFDAPVEPPPEKKKPAPRRARSAPAEAEKEKKPRAKRAPHSKSSG